LHHISLTYNDLSQELGTLSLFNTKADDFICKPQNIKEEKKYTLEIYRYSTPSQAAMQYLKPSRWKIGKG
jgi:hypothetical protein